MTDQEIHKKLIDMACKADIKIMNVLLDAADKVGEIVYSQLDYAAMQDDEVVQPIRDRLEAEGLPLKGSWRDEPPMV